jgi:AcrR family transcriptional regulator
LGENFLKTLTDDRRVRKTKKALREGLAEILMTKDLRKITVRELTDKVDIHRATFYAHYQDIYDLFDKMEDAVVEEINDIFRSESYRNYEDLLKKLICYIDDNRKISKMFLCKNGNGNFSNRVRNLLSNKYIELWQNELHDKKIPDYGKMYTAYHISGCLAIVSEWADSDFTLPKEKIIEIMATIDASFDKLLS